VVKLFANPLILRALAVLLAAGCSFLFAIFLMRRLRRNIAAEADLDSAAAPTLETLPVQLYSTVIQQLKQQKHELQVQTLTEQRRARTTENFSQTVLSNLPSGVLVFGLNGLVKQANPAAKEILGFRSLSGMSAENIFRDAAVCPQDSSAVHSMVWQACRFASPRSFMRCCTRAASVANSRQSTPLPREKDFISRLRFPPFPPSMAVCSGWPVLSATAVSSNTSDSSNNCTTSFPPKWHWSCAPPWLLSPDTPNSWREIGNQIWPCNWLPT